MPMRLLDEEHGATVVEAAVVLPVFFLMLFGLFSFLLLLFGYGNAVYATRQGARYASLHSSTSLAPASAASVQSFVTPLLVAVPVSGLSINSAWSPTNTIGGTVTVSISISYTMMAPVHSITVGASAQRTIIR